MADIYAISMNKGGVGKTSLVSNLAGAIGKQTGKKVLIVDTDGQGNTSIAFGLNPNNFENTIYDVLMGSITAEVAIIKTEHNVDILPSNADMDFFDFDVLTNKDDYPKPFFLLKEALADIKDDYDYIFIDTPPSMGLVAGNVLACADKVIIPFVPETFAVQGLIRVVKAINGFKAKDNPDLEIAGVLGMMVQGGTVIHSQMLQQARRYCTENNIHIYETTIPKSIRFANSTAYEGKPAVWTDSNNPIVGAYYELLNEVIN